MIRNGDAHLKNFAVVYDNATEVCLAPFYDLVNTCVYMPRDMPALTLEGKKEWPDLEALKRFGLGVCGLRTREVKACVEEVRAGIEATIPRLESYGRDNPQHLSLCEKMIKGFASSF